MVTGVLETAEAVKTGKVWARGELRAGNGADPETARFLAELMPFVPELRGYLRRRLPANDVEDVVQDVLVRLLHRGGGDVTFPRRYLYQTAVAILIDRSRTERSRCSSLHCDLEEADQVLEELSPDRVILAREEIQIARKVLSALPERTRAVLIAVRIDGQRIKAVAEEMGISVSAVEKHLIKALKALRQACEPAGTAPAALAS